ncbi:hypothetical protein V8E51_013149 [Hyaloscypha variabilis]
MPSLSTILIVANLPPSTDPLEAREPCFTLFSKLAPELRLKIWGYALPGPRVIRLSLKLNPAYNPDPDYVKYEQCDVVAKPAVPALLHACHEARIVALQVYKQAFASRLRDAIYFDFNQDILFGDDNVISAFFAKGEKVENAIPAQGEPAHSTLDDL